MKRHAAQPVLGNLVRAQSFFHYQSPKDGREMAVHLHVQLLRFRDSGLIDISSFCHVSGLLLHHTRQIAPLIFKYDPYHTSLLLGKHVMNKHAGKHHSLYNKVQEGFLFIAAKQLNVRRTPLSSV